MLFEAVGSVLTSANLGDLGTDIYAELPDQPAECLAIRQYAGRPPEHAKDRREPYYTRPRFQVVTRAETHTASRQKAHDAFDALSGFFGILEGESWSIRALQSPFPLGKDQSGRTLYSANYEAIVGG